MKLTFKLLLLISAIASAPVFSSENCNNVKLDESELPELSITDDFETFKAQKAKYELKLVSKKISCFIAIDKPNGEDKKQLVSLIKEQAKLVSKTANENIEIAKPPVKNQKCLDITIEAPETPVTDAPEKIKSAQQNHRLREISEQIQCLTAKNDKTEQDQEALKRFNKEQKEIIDPSPKITSPQRWISALELGVMQMPNYEENGTGKFEKTKPYGSLSLDAYSETPFWIFNKGKPDEGKVYLNTSIDIDLWGTGTFKQEDAIDPQDITFNDISDTVDVSANFQLPCYSNKKEEENFLCPHEKDRAGGLLLSAGFYNRDKKLENEDSINFYYGIGYQYRGYYDEIVDGTSALPFIEFSAVLAKFQSYGVIKDPENPEMTKLNRDAKRLLLDLSYKPVRNAPFTIGLKANLGEGPDDYGITLGFRKTGDDLLSFFTNSKED